MSAFSIFSPILRSGRRIGGAIPNPSWTCRACSRSQAQSRINIAGGIRGGRTFATETSEATRDAGRAAPKNKKRRRLIIAAGGLVTAGGVAVAVSDDAKHAYTATKRSYRVLETLFLNVREYVHSRPNTRLSSSLRIATATATFSSATTTPSTKRSSKHATYAAPNEPSARWRRTARSS